MKIIYHLMIMPLAFMTISTAAVTQAESDVSPTPLEQNTPVVSQDPQIDEEESSAASVPELYIPEKNHQFENVPAGQTVTHEYILYNKGTAPLHITRVKTGWGCSAASYTRQIPPGGEGKISVKVNTTSYAGRTLKKNIVVSTTDPQKPSVTLTISGMVEKFVDIKPKYVRLTGTAGQDISTLVSVIPVPKYNFKIIEVNAMKGRDIQFSLSEKNFSQDNGYEILVKNLKTDPGRYQDVLSLKTDSNIQPVIKVSIYGNISKPKTE